MTGSSEVITPVAAVLRLPSGSKRAAIQALAETLAQAAALDPRFVQDAVLLRERLSPTGLGEGVALPHARLPGLEASCFAFGRVDPPVDFAALDGRPVDLVVLLLTPAERGADHLKTLARLSRRLKRPELRERLRAARSAEDAIAAFAERVESDAA